MPADLLLLFANSAGQLFADSEGFLRTHWSTQARTLADTQALFRAMSEALYQRGWSRIMINQSAMLPFTPAEQQWVAREWLTPAVQECGYRCGAVVVSTDIYTRLATAYITNSVAGLALRYRSFDQETEAVAWLRQQPG